MQPKGMPDRGGHTYERYRTVLFRSSCNISKLSSPSETATPTVPYAKPLTCCPRVVQRCNHSVKFLQLPHTLLEEIISITVGRTSGTYRVRALLGLSRVSRHMWAVTHGASRLWAVVDMESSVQLNTYILHKSGSAPLDIIYQFHDSYSSGNKELILKELHRWKSVAIRSTRWRREFEDLLDNEQRDWLGLFEFNNSANQTKIISVGKALGHIQSLDLESIPIPIHQIQIRSESLRHIRLQVGGTQEDHTLAHYQDIVKSCPCLESLYLKVHKPNVHRILNAQSTSPILLGRLQILQLEGLDSLATLELLACIRSPVLASVEINPRMQIKNPKGTDVNWIIERTTSDSALFVLLSSFTGLNLGCDHGILHVFGSTDGNQPWMRLDMPVKGRIGLVKGLLHFVNSYHITHLRLSSDMMAGLLPERIMGFKNLKDLTLFDGGTIDRVLDLMGSKDSASDCWALPMLEYFTIVDCGFQQQALIQFVQARYGAPGSSNRPVPLVCLQILELRYDIQLLKIENHVREQVEAVLGKFNVVWPVPETPVVNHTSSSDDGDSDLESNDEGNTHHWRRRRR